MTIIHASIAVVIIVLALTLVLAATGRVQTTPGSQRWLAAVLGVAVIGAVALLVLDKGPAEPSTETANALPRFIASLPSEVRGADADQTRARIAGLVQTRPDETGLGCQELIAQNAEFAQVLKQMRTDIRQAAELADTQRSTIERLKEENLDLQQELQARP
jgi:hypothetical protein